MWHLFPDIVVESYCMLCPYLPLAFKQTILAILGIIGGRPGPPGQLFVFKPSAAQGEGVDATP